MKDYIKSDREAMRQHYLDRRANAKAKKAESREGVLKIVRDEINDVTSPEDALELLFREFVPDSGAASTVGGEIVRAMMRILYRDYNDGDVFYEGYGIETCGEAVAFLCDMVPHVEDQFDDIASGELSDSSYTRALGEIVETIFEHFDEDPDILFEKNKYDYLDRDGKSFIEDMGWEPKYDFECDYPDNVQFHLDEEDISERDIEWELESWDYVRDYEVRANRYGITIYDMKKEDYDEVEDSMYRWLEQWGDDLDDEYGSEEDRESEGEDEDEEYDEEE